MLSLFLDTDEIEDLTTWVHDVIVNSGTSEPTPFGQALIKYASYLRARGLAVDETLETETGMQDYNQFYNAVLIRLFRF